MENALMTTSAQEPVMGVCTYCGGPIDLTTRYWRKFCNDRCRYRWHQDASRLGRRILAEQAETSKVEPDGSDGEGK